MTNDNNVGIIREQGEFFDVKKLSEEDMKVYEAQQKREKEEKDK